MTEKRTKLICAALLVAVTVAVYWPVTGCDFINYDDPDYVTNNPMVQHGLTAQSVTWAFTQSHASNWHPLTWLSHMLDCALFGLKPGAHHAVNLLFHTANTVLLFLVLNNLTRAVWRSALAAALFAWHPLHVESVAWVSERKDVLSAFFWLLTMAVYAKFTGLSKAQSPKSKVYYVVALLFFACGLMAKPMVVTLPFVLLLLDFWPLGRIYNFETGRRSESFIRLCVEKLPFFCLSALTCVVTVWSQRAEHSVVSTATLSLPGRMANVLVSYVLYLGKTIWPTNLALPYPFSHEWTLLQATGAGLLLMVLTAIAVLNWRTRPQLAVGWFWFLGTLVPVIGLVQVGLQSMADRYTYLPLIGIFVALVWGIPGRWAVWPRPGMLCYAAGSAILILLLLATSLQLTYWQNSVSLFSHTTAVTKDNILAEYNLAQALAARGDEPDAVTHYQR
ncbi:MAG TPA: hypothetical protein VFC07_13300, partial [Verrucomicrobiae bacterium]|nr:hypothetical protein [Verrucomicrobiae bacterium]